MQKYRIIKKEYFGGNVYYEVQKRLFGFLWWYNFENIDEYSTGIYKTYKEAEDAINRHKYTYKKTIIRVD